MSNAIDSTLGTSVTQASTTAASTKKKSSLSINDFYKLLSAEMQYQDPLSSSDSGGSSSSSSNYINEILQFTMLDQMQSITTSMNTMMAANAMGKYVCYNTTDSNGKTVQQYGTIDGVDMTGDSPRYLINDLWVTQSNVTQFYDVQNANLFKALNLTTAASAIGKYANYSTVDENNKPLSGTGQITSVDLSGNAPSYRINDLWIPQSDIMKVSDKPISTTDSSSTSGTTQT